MLIVLDMNVAFNYGFYTPKFSFVLCIATHFVFVINVPSRPIKKVGLKNCIVRVGLEI